MQQEKPGWYVHAYTYVRTHTYCNKHVIQTTCHTRTYTWCHLLSPCHALARGQTVRFIQHIERSVTLYQVINLPHLKVNVIHKFHTHIAHDMVTNNFNKAKVHKVCPSGSQACLLRVSLLKLLLLCATWRSSAC